MHTYTAAVAAALLPKAFTPTTVYIVGAMGATDAEFAVAAMPLGVHAYEVAAGVQVAVNRDVPPDGTTAGEALSMQMGAPAAATVTTVLLGLPVPAGLMPATV